MTGAALAGSRWPTGTAGGPRPAWPAALDPSAAHPATSWWPPSCGPPSRRTPARLLPARGACGRSIRRPAGPARVDRPAGRHSHELCGRKRAEALAALVPLLVDMESAWVDGQPSEEPSGRGAVDIGHGRARSSFAVVPAPSVPCSQCAGLSSAGHAPAVRTRSCSPARARSAPAWTVPSRSSSAPSSATGARSIVRRQIVHNLHVVADLEAKGAVFVEELDEVPDGATSSSPPTGSPRPCDGGSRSGRT